MYWDYATGYHLLSDIGLGSFCRALVTKEQYETDI